VRTDTSSLLITGSAANQMKLYEVASGKCIFTWEFDTAVKRVAFSEDGTQVLAITEQRMGFRGTLQVFRINRDPASWTTQSREPLRVITFSGPKATVAAWAPADQYIVTGHDNGKVALYYHDEKEPESGVDAELEENSVMAHPDHIVTDLQMSADKTYCITSSKDKTSKVSAAWLRARGLGCRVSCGKGCDRPLRARSSGWCSLGHAERIRAAAGQPSACVWTSLCCSWAPHIASPVLSSLLTHPHAQLIDTKSLSILKTYTTATPLNSAAIHPTRPYVIIGGGQDAMNVTTTSARQGRFEARFWHKVFEEECCASCCAALLSVVPLLTRSCAQRRSDNISAPSTPSLCTPAASALPAAARTATVSDARSRSARPWT
jgi:WD40 repeat protein